MKQLIRFFISPAVFVNQLQWSKNHAMIMLTFLGLAIVESQIGAGRVLNGQLSWLLASQTGIERDQALFLVQVIRIAFLFFGAFSLTETVWWIGSRLGHSTSKRVLQRRLAVVMTFLLAAYTLATALPADSQWIAAVLFGWGLMMNYLTLREQFSMGRFTAALVGLVAVGSILLSWQFTDRVTQKVAHYAIGQHVAKAKTHHHRR